MQNLNNKIMILKQLDRSGSGKKEMAPMGISSSLL